MSINVNYGALSGGSEQIQTVTNNLVSRLESLQSSLRNVASGWQGEAHRAFHQNMDIFTRELDKLRAVQTNLGRAVGNSGVAYREEDIRGAKRTYGA